MYREKDLIRDVRDKKVLYYLTDSLLIQDLLANWEHVDKVDLQQLIDKSRKKFR